MRADGIAIRTSPASLSQQLYPLLTIQTRSFIAQVYHYIRSLVNTSQPDIVRTYEGDYHYEAWRPRENTDLWESRDRARHGPTENGNNDPWMS